MSGFEQGYALIIGINDYPDIGKLSVSVLKDALSIHTALKAFGGYAKNHLQTLINEQANDTAIRKGLEWLADSAGPNTTAVVYFSGHGGRIEIDSQVKHYLIPHNCDLSNLDGTAISSSDLTEMLRAIKAQRLVCFFDSCYSGGVGETKGVKVGLPTFKHGPEKDYYNQLAQGSGRVIIASSRSSELSRILPEMNNSLFTHYLLEILQGEAPRQSDGLIRVVDIFRYIAEKVPQQSQQHPTMSSTETENFPIALYRGGQQNANDINQVALREAMVSAFSKEDLEALCADIEQALHEKNIDLLVNLDMVGGSGKRGIILNLIGYLYRQGYLLYLVDAVRKVRPHIVF